MQIYLSLDGCSVACLFSSSYEGLLECDEKCTNIALEFVGMARSTISVDYERWKGST